jgi:hypothetical protein
LFFSAATAAALSLNTEAFNPKTFSTASSDVDATAAPSFAFAATRSAIDLTEAILLPLKVTIAWFDL